MDNQVKTRILSPIRQPSQPEKGPAQPDVSTTTPAPEKKASEGEFQCPRCGSKLLNPESLGLCHRCGYLKSLEENIKQTHLPGVAVLSPKNPSEGHQGILPAVRFGIADCLHAVRCSPSWLWGLLTGIFVFTVASLVADRLLPLDSLARALWSSIQAGIGVLLIIGTQFYAVLRVSANDSSVGGRHIFVFSGRLWGLVFRQLPATRWIVWLETWGVVLTLCGAFVIGGFGYWMQHYHPREVVSRELLDAADSWNENSIPIQSPDKSGIDTLGVPTVAKEISAKSPASVEPKSADPRPSIQTAIIGYIPDADGSPKALILARLVDGKWVLAGTVHRGLLPQQTNELKDRLADLVQFKPQIPGLATPNAVWVKPGMFCSVHISGISPSGDLVDPSFKGILNNGLR